ncbi:MULTISPECIES: cell envelope integrity protein CreD [Moraxella]|uniref:Inner membrane protein CreD n=1 Tax=Moraxella lacunata TaxID=477 RepID=A0A1B8PVD4_MORLA|nr:MULTISPECIES: cell envelope integrity protein CreD [Moraxella]MBE9578858.1 inner membrane CreD family protein [Moraxella sp. K1664]MBE9589137.1 inner membrane CreD family protein [Moraxella sp. K1630]MBE9589883.1 inner membrane CreD family protein [Moraxella sp. K127]MBE9597383.1 inner membrane CreD family protein [Moraxella sp. K2450]MDH9218835.1 cell envelope integrity protein CreD [Moraxella lacunata]
MQKIGTKLSLIGAVCLVFFVGLMFVSGLVSERQSYHDEVISEIKSSHVSSQILATPFLVAGHGDEKHYIFPTKSDIKATSNVRDDEYKRGIYRAISYGTKVVVQQSFNAHATAHTLHIDKPAEPTQTASPDSQAQNEQAQNQQSQNEQVQSNPNEQVATQNSQNQTTQATPTPTEPAKSTPKPLRLIIALSDLRGVMPTDVTVNGKSYPTTFGTDNALPHLEVALPMTLDDFIKDDFMGSRELNVQFELDVSGIGSFGVLPLGEMNTVTLNSNWQNPKFHGQALPTHKSLTDNGFGATWQAHVLGVQNQKLIMELSRGIMGDFDQHTHYALMTDFIHTNDTYTKTDRSIKYALLIIMVSFGTFFLFEVIKACAIHPIQYLLVASALLVFYLLLLSLAEHIAFLYAYIIASLACVGLIGWYACYMLGSFGRGMGFGAVLGTLYACFYAILSASGMNLLMGSVFSFVCIAVIMVATRHVDWYGMTGQNDDSESDENESNENDNTPLMPNIHLPKATPTNQETTHD